MFEKFFSLKNVLKSGTGKSPEIGDLKNAVVRKKLEERLCKSEERYRLLAELAQEMIFVIGRDGLVRYVNSFAAKSLGKQPREIIGKPRDIFFSSESSRRQNELINDVFRTGKPVYTESEVEFSGRNVWLSTRLVPVRGGNGAIIEVFGISRDITKQKEGEQKLRESEENYRTIIEASKDMIWTLDKCGRLLFINKAAEKLGGYSLNELKGKDFSFGLNKEDIPRVSDIFKKTLKGIRQDYEASIRCKNGDLRVLSVSTSPIYSGGNVIGTVSFGEDITERKYVENALKENEEKYRTIVENSNDLIWTVDVKGNFTFFNRRAEYVSGYKQKELCGKPFTPIVVGEDLPKIISVFRKILSGSKEHYEVSARKKSGEIFTLSVNAVPIYSGRKIVGVSNFGRDITLRKSVEAELLKFKLGLERSTDAVFITDPEGTIIYANPAFEHVYGYKKEEVLGKTPRIIKSGLIPEKQYRQFWGALLAKQTVAGEIINKRKNGALLNIDGSNNPLVDDSGNIVGFLAIHRDITGRKKAEGELKNANESLKEAQRMANFGNWEWDVLTNEVIWSEQVYRIYGLDPKKDKPTYNAVIDTLAPECRKRFIDAIKGSLKRAAPFEGEYCIILPDGAKRYTHTAGSIVKGKNGKPVKMFGVVQDITERKTSEYEKEKMNKELQSKVDELERFNRLAVGRELKMVELKKKIKVLEEKTQG